MKGLKEMKFMKGWSNERIERNENWNLWKPGGVMKGMKGMKFIKAGINERIENLGSNESLEIFERIDKWLKVMKVKSIIYPHLSMKGFHSIHGF